MVSNFDFTRPVVPVARAPDSPEPGALTADAPPPGSRGRTGGRAR